MNTGRRDLLKAAADKSQSKRTRKAHDPADIDAIVDRCIEANYKYPWSFVCRALSGLDTAIWDLMANGRRKASVSFWGAV